MGYADSDGATWWLLEDAALWNLIGLEWEGKGNSGVYIAHFQLSDLIWRISCPSSAFVHAFPPNITLIPLAEALPYPKCNQRHGFRGH